MYVNPLFWFLVAVAFTALQFVAVEASRTRAALYSILGVIGIVLVLKISLGGIAILAVCGLSIWLGCRRLAARGVGDGTALVFLASAPLLLFWVLAKSAVAFEWPRQTPLLLVGLSYLLVKAWSLLKDVADDKVRNVEPLEFIAYFLHLPTFVVGPMHYFGEFRDTLRRPYPLSAESLLDIVFRFVLGLFKVYVLAGLLAPISLLGLVEVQNIDLGRLFTAAVVYSFVLYLDFSGYCDMAIAVSRLLGIDVPENFNWPYLASSVREFWRRWHITFTRALTAHVFIPLTRRLQRQWPRAPGLVSFFGYTGTFLFCGFWHGATANFLLWGLWHALGLVAQDAWARHQRTRGVIKPSPAMGVLVRFFDTALTFTFVSLGWIFFVLPISKLASIKVW